MTQEEAKRYFDAIVGNMPITIEDLKADLRLCHILVHNSGAIPEGVDEDEFIDEILETLSV